MGLQLALAPDPTVINRHAAGRRRGELGMQVARMKLTPHAFAMERPLYSYASCRWFLQVL